VAKIAREDLPPLEAALASKSPHDGINKCATMANIDTLAKADKPLADKYTKLCTHDLWTAQLKVSVEAAEAEHAAKPNDPMRETCFDAYLAMANDELATAKQHDDATRALLARYVKVCPEGLKK
jgi:hypothetical protein